MDARTLKCKNKQTSERTKNQTNQETNKYTIVKQNLSGLIAGMDRVIFLKQPTLPPNYEVPEKSTWARLDDTRTS